MPALTFSHVSKSYQKAGRPAVVDVTLAVESGEFVVLLGPSGCGKTTLLKMTNRLIEPTSGSISLDGTDIRELSLTSLRRRMGYVIQQVGLFPHLTVASNVQTVPRLLGWPKAKIRSRSDELLELVGLEPASYRRRYPRQLSGGQQQRVGLARALAADPAVMLMDEPFGAIDAITRGNLQDQLMQIQRRLRKTVLFVTHDVEEAIRLADRLVVMESGCVVQYDTPFNILTNPANDFVRELLNTNDVLRELSVISVRSAMDSVPPAAGDTEILGTRSLRDALSLMLGVDRASVAVVDEAGARIGSITMEAIRQAGAKGRAERIAAAAGSV